MLCLVPCCSLISVVSGIDDLFIWDIQNWPKTHYQQLSYYTISQWMHTSDVSADRSIYCHCFWQRLQQKLFHFFPVLTLIQKMVVISMELAYLQYSKGTKYCNPKQGEKDHKLKNSFHVLFTSYIWLAYHYLVLDHT